MEKLWLKNYPLSVSPEIDPNKYKNILEVFDEACAKYRTKRAFSNMGASITYEDLDRLSGRFASFLQHELKMKKGDRIALQMPNIMQFPVALFGALRAGLVVVNTNPLYTAREMSHQFRDSGATTLVILANFAHLLKEVIPETKIKNVVITQLGDMLPFPKNLLVNSVVKYIKKMVPAYEVKGSISFNQSLEIGSKVAYDVVKLESTEIAFLQYTGGTTGVSKGAMLTHRNIIANMMQICEWMKPRLVEGQEIALAPLPLYHIFSLTVNALSFLKYGAENVLITNPRDIPGFIKEMRTSQFTLMSGVNTLYNALANHPDIKSVDFSRVKINVAGGMALQTAVSQRWLEVTGSSVIEGYGLTETSPVAVCNPVDGTHRPGFIGLPVPSTDIRIINDEGKELGRNEVGEICIKGPQVMGGYWQRPDETKNVLNDGWLATGDIGLVDDSGFCKIVDRKKDMILVSGFNVYPNEVEEVISAHPKVLEVAAIGVPDVHSGEIVKVFIVKKDPSLNEKEVIEFSQKSLTNYKVPKLVEFRSELPKTNVGKILRRALRDEKK